jgi:hypothetical protein
VLKIQIESSNNPHKEQVVFLSQDSIADAVLPRLKLSNLLTDEIKVKRLPWRHDSYLGQESFYFCGTRMFAAVFSKVCHRTFISIKVRFNIVISYTHRVSETVSYVHIALSSRPLLLTSSHFTLTIPFHCWIIVLS